MIVFDLDDTLYQNQELSQRNTDLTKKWIRRELELTDQELESLYNSLPEKHPNPLKGIESIDLSVKEYYKNVFSSIDPSKYLSERPELSREIDRLEDRKIVVSFAPENYCWKVLEALGIDSHFNNVYSASKFNNSKEEVYRRLDNIRLIVGDNYRADLKPGLDLGLEVIHVSQDCNINAEHRCRKNILETLGILPH